MTETNPGVNPVGYELAQAPISVMLQVSDGGWSVSVTDPVTGENIGNPTASKADCQ